MKIAVIGAGISGMVAAYLLCREHDLVVFEANDYVGGHTHTIPVESHGVTYHVDTGFIVFNQQTYPNFVTLLRKLGVAWQDSKMSFSVKCENTGLEFSPDSFRSLFAQRRNLIRPSFYRMLLDIFRFRRESRELLLQKHSEETLAQYLERNQYSHAFIHYMILPMGQAIWSADPKKFRHFPARYFVEFFENHGFLNLRHKPQWLVIQGGSERYVQPLIDPYRHCIRLGSPVRSIRRFADRVEVTVKGDEPEPFDQVILATHSDQALAMLVDASEAEQEILRALPYQPNETILHTDTSILPQREAAWASWNYHVPREELGRVAVTYNMNLLQSLRAPVVFCVTLNRADAIDSSQVIHTFQYAHPIYTPQGVQTRARRDEISGNNRTYFAGAYWGYGFHEDGVNSALEVCKHFGKTLDV